MTEIETRSPATEAEPTLTLTQLTALLREAAAYERAQRPVILHTPAEPVTAPQTAPVAHPGVAIPVPAAPVATVTDQAPERRFTLAELVGWCGLGVAGSGIATMLALAFAGSPDIATAGIATVAGFATSLGAAVATTNSDDKNQAQAWETWKATHQ
jgi:hypothetical protein